LVRPEDLNDTKFNSANLRLVEADIEWFGVKEQTELLRIIN
jgi:hypothetical protein